MNTKQMYNDLVMTNYFIFGYNLETDQNEDFFDLEIPN